MSGYFYSASTNAFYAGSLFAAYQAAGTWPDDAVPVDESVFAEFSLGNPPPGKHRVAGPDGLPMWADIPPAPAVVPQSVTRRQARLALLEVGKLDDVEAAIEAIDDPIQKRAAQIEYEADTWERDNEFLRSMWAALGGTEQDLDDLFALAASK